MYITFYIRIFLNFKIKQISCSESTYQIWSLNQTRIIDIRIFFLQYLISYKACRQKENSICLYHYYSPLKNIPLLYIARLRTGTFSQNPNSATSICLKSYFLSIYCFMISKSVMCQMLVIFKRKKKRMAGYKELKQKVYITRISSFKFLRFFNKKYR